MDEHIESCIPQGDIDNSLEKYFTKDEWQRMGVGAKIHYTQIKMNFDAMMFLGLNPSRPSFMNLKGTKAKAVDCSDNTENELEAIKFDDKSSIVKIKEEKTDNHGIPVSNENQKGIQEGQYASICKLEFNCLEQYSEVHSESGSQHLMENDNFGSLSSFNELKPKQKDNFSGFSIEKLHDTKKHLKLLEDLTVVGRRRLRRKITSGLCIYKGTFLNAEWQENLNEENPNRQDSRRALYSTPQGLFVSSDYGDKIGSAVWTNLYLSEGTLFGPYEGVHLTDETTAQTSGYCWQILRNGISCEYIDAGDSACSNWLRYVNYAHSEESKNLSVLQFKHNIYYKVCKPVLPGNELLVWYSDSYIHEKIRKDTNQPKFVLSNSDCKGYECHKCHRLFTTPHALVMHKKQHRNEGFGKHCCHLCPYSTSKLKDMKKHLDVHSGVRPHKCSYCGKGFSQKQNLKHHIYIHTGERPFGCKICGKGFRQSGDLKRHMRTHIEDRPYMCRHCGRAFKENQDLTKHERIHTGQRPYKCPHCDLWFSRTGHVKSHVINIHTREFPHKCNHCNKGFISPSELRLHLINDHDIG